MTFGELYGDGSKPVISFEIFPPKTPEGKSKLMRTLEELAEMRPAFISVDAPGVYLRYLRGDGNDTGGQF
ncbi:MAG: methylenetetrahydrofolate reductase [Candidatus Dadabacteria bacterium]|nr:methylenetetrahydrofolate reductase [Candidatus Dadabacteria bacterium]